MLDSRSPWYSVGASRTDLEATSSHSLLHSIYGSQASQLLYSDFDSETSLHGTRSTEYVPPTRTRRALNRPKSSPASVIQAREEYKRNVSNSNSYSPAVSRQRRPGTAATSRVGTRPISAAGNRQRPVRPSTAAAGFRGGAGRARGSSRPSTALGVRRSLTQLVDLEEEQIDPAPPIIRDTQPVHLTRTPEYVYFWEGKPLQRRDFSIKPQKRKAWQRPKSDYGNRFLNKHKNKSAGDGLGSGTGLETLVEREDSSGAGTRRGSKDTGMLDRDGKGDGDDLLKGSRRGSKDSDDLSRRNRHGRSRDTSRDGKSDRFDRSKWAQKNVSSTSDGHVSDGYRLGTVKHSPLRPAASFQDGDTDQEASALAEDDDFFKKNESEQSDKDLQLPPINSSSSLCSVLEAKKENWAPSSGSQDFAKPHELNMRNDQLSRIGNSNSSRKLPLKVLQRNDRSNDVDISTTQCPRKLLSSMSWMDGGGSSNTTRFELPMDMKQLEGMSPLQYLRKHCIISNRRMAHCSKVFTKLDKDKDAQINKEELKDGLMEALHNCVSPNQVDEVMEVAVVNDDIRVDARVFTALCCLAERVLNLYFLPLARKEVIELVDFEALEWKLRGCSISPSLHRLFTQL